MSEIEITEWKRESLTMKLPGLTAIRVDTARRIIAVDCISGTAGQDGIGEDWKVLDLRGGTYGDFHRLGLAEQCPDRDCAAAGEHRIAGED